METIEINKLLRPLVIKFIEIDDYDKMKTILDIGLSGVNVIEKYSNYKNENIETDILYQEEIKKYKLQIEELEKINRKFQYENENIETNILYQEERKKYKLQIEELEIKNNKIKNEKQEIESNIFNIKKEGYNERELVRNELENKYNKELNYYKEQINKINDEKILLIQSFDDIKKSEVNEKTEELRIVRDKLEKEIIYLKQLYVDKSKGTKYENELIPKFEEYNDNKLNNKWRILHVGSSLNHKCDFHIKNKDTGEIILIDTKNNESHKPVSKDDIDKFVSDVTSIGNNAIGGILIANNKICKKRNFDINIINNKILLYISHFSFNNIEFIFSMIELICDRSRNIKSGFDEKFIKNNLIDNYTFLIERLNNNKLEGKKYEKELNNIGKKFNKLFNDDIEIYYKGIENLEKKMDEKVENKNQEIIDFEEIEKDSKVIGKQRTKYYLKYQKNGENIVQYFQNNYPKNKKIKILEKDKNIIINNK
jgi:hypothetical protein